MFKKLAQWSFFLFSVVLYAQYSISGYVYDENFKPVSNTEINLKHSNKIINSQTNEEGKYQFFNLESGNYVLIVKEKNKTQEFQVKINNQNIEFDPTITLNKEVTLETIKVSKIRSVKSELEKKGFAVNVIETKEASERNTQTLELLDQSVGVRIRQDGGLGSNYQFNINGMTGNSIKVFIDGLPMETYGGSFSLNSIPPAMIERVEVFKGVVPGYLANDALGGAINIVLKNYYRNNLSASLSYGSFNTTQANFSANYRAKSGFTFKTSMFYNYSDNDYKVWGRSIYNTNPNGTIEYIKARRFNDAYYSYGSITEIGVTKTKWADKFLIGYSNSFDYNEIQHGRFMNRAYMGRYAKRNAHIASIAYNKKDFLTSGLDINFRAIYTERKQLLSDTNRLAYNWNGKPIIDLNGRPVRSSYGAQQGTATINHIDRKSASANAGVSYKINNHHSFSFNYLFFHQNRKDNDELRAVVENLYNESNKITKNNFALSYELTAFEEKLKTSLFGKYYMQSIERTKPIAVKNELNQDVRVLKKDQSDVNENGYGFAASYLISNSIMIMASAEKAIRMPSEGEVFGNVADNKQENFYLKPEKSNNYNLGFKAGPYEIGKFHKAGISVNGFIRDTRDRIYEFEITKNISVQETYQSKNQLKTMSRGIDLEFNYSYKDNLRLFFNLSRFKSFMNNKKETYTYKEQLPNEPYFTMNTNAQYSFKNILSKGSRLILYYNFRFVGEFNSLLIEKLQGADHFKVPSQNIHDVGITYKFPNQHFMISLDAKNIFDKQAFDNFAVQKPGRAFYVKLNYLL
ncbi:TonB-dependent receptor plug domain-containing protein [Apibacter sp. HY039]|uniref:TonB-dependent receptor n=1 Tax=Apibacter sp. HY039 TaxID=2501476 RepID=UPI000FEC1563|nr:TonB-dependent receptor plug domain-containing protein [Apibacter sp. HY039]